jgi:hypothetical protein
MQDPEPTEEKMVGFYTLKERQAKIRKYKEKILRWMRGENKNKDRYILRSKIAKAKPRVGGKFARKSEVSALKANSSRSKPKH